MNSPSGQLKEMVSDVKKILNPESLLTDELIHKYAREYNLRYGAVVTTPMGTRVVLTKESEVDENNYFDSKNGIMFAVDHLTRETIESISDKPSSLAESESQLITIQDFINKYMIKRYTTQENAGIVYSSSETIISIKIVAEKANLGNFWSGRWTSSWKIKTPPRIIAMNSNDDDADLLLSNQVDKSAQITGQINILAHYFEDGNVQLNTSKAIPSTTLNYNSEIELGEAIAKHIEITENQIQSGLNEMYSSMNDLTLRALRRILPVTRSKMEWNRQAHVMAKAVGVFR